MISTSDRSLASSLPYPQNYDGLAALDAGRAESVLLISNNSQLHRWHWPTDSSPLSVLHMESTGRREGDPLA